MATYIMSAAQGDEKWRPTVSCDGASHHDDYVKVLKTLFKKQAQIPSDPPSESPRPTNGSSSSSSSLWEPVQLGDGQHSLPGGGITIVSGINLILFVGILAGLATGWFWYGNIHSAGLPSWAAGGVTLLAVGLSVAALLTLIMAAVKGCAIVIGWITVRVVWVVLILGVLIVVQKGAVAYSEGGGVDPQIMFDCHLCSSLRSSAASAVSNSGFSFSEPEILKSGGGLGSICADGRNGVSAGKHISGRVSQIQSGLGMSIVTVKVKGQEPLRAVLTNQVVHELDLKEDDAVVVFVKATKIRIAKGDLGTATLGFAVQNILSGQAVDLQNGNTLGCLTMTDGNWKLKSAMTQLAMEDLQFKAGEPVTATVQATDVLLRKEKAR